MKVNKLGDRMPDTRDPKWGSMKAGESHLSDEWHGMNPSEGHMSDKWVEMEHGKGHMSDKYVEMEAGEPMGDQWHEMKQEGRQDPYSMAPSEGNRKESYKPMAKETGSNKHGRASQHTEFGSTREI